MAASVPPLRLKAVMAGSENGTVDFLIVDESTNAMDAVRGKAAIYCVVKDRLTASIFVKSVNHIPSMVKSIEALIEDIKVRLADADHLASVGEARQTLEKFWSSER